MVDDLLSPYLPLLRPSPNTRGNQGVRSDAYIVNPMSSRNPLYLEMLVFFGKLMGSAIRSKQYLSMSLAPLVWKLICEEEVTFEDLAAVDLFEYQNLDQLRYRLNKAGDQLTQLTENNFEFSDHAYRTFTVQSFSGYVEDVFELIPGGTDINLSFDTIDLYFEKKVSFLLNEMKPVCKAIRRGIQTQIPPAILSLLSWDQIEESVCGKAIIDVELLKSVTEYSSCKPQDPHILWFWDVFENHFTNEDRSAFVRFAWGRSRLPLNVSGFSNKFKIQNLNKSPPDKYLPESHTCFFTVDIPKYTSKEVLLAKLKYAVHNCTSIDGDGNTNRAAGMTYES